jgi:type IV secretory pathway ATPase VirB11/archaellum biosynthesis ATPase
MICQQGRKQCPFNAVLSTEKANREKYRCASLVHTEISVQFPMLDDGFCDGIAV